MNSELGKKRKRQRKVEIRRKKDYLLGIKKNSLHPQMLDVL